MLWHHMTIFVDLNTKTFTMSIDNGIEILSMAISSALDSTMYLGHENYGLNGYIRNFVITTTEMTDFTQLPVKDGFKGCFDYTNYNGGSIWTNQYTNGSRINFNMSNAVKSDGCILFPETLGLGYLIDDIGDNFTVYAIIKGDKSTSAVSNSSCWTIATFGADSSHRVYAGQFSDDNTYTFWSPTITKTNESASEWHVISYSVNNTEQKFYIDGELIVSTNTLTNFSVDSLCINTAAYNGAIPTVVTNSANVYLKYIGYATNNHSETQIQQNSDWLLEHYGLKAPRNN